MSGTQYVIFQYNVGCLGVYFQTSGMIWSCSDLVDSAFLNSIAVVT